MARPTKRTPGQREALLRAGAAGMSSALFRQWRADDATLAADVADAQREAEAEGERRLEALLADLKREAEIATWQDAARWLERRFPDVWGPPEQRAKRRNRGR
jgi:Flp pilus assembly CpaE family ATPase